MIVPLLLLTVPVHVAGVMVADIATYVSVMAATVLVEVQPVAGSNALTVYTPPTEVVKLVAVDVKLDGPLHV
jgi:hypothetical protein